MIRITLPFRLVITTAAIALTLASHPLASANCGTNEDCGWTCDPPYYYAPGKCECTSTGTSCTGCCSIKFYCHCWIGDGEGLAVNNNIAYNPGICAIEVPPATGSLCQDNSNP